MNALLRRRMMMVAMEGEEEMATAKTIVDYTIEEEVSEIAVSLSAEDAKAINEANAIYFALEMMCTTETEEMGSLTLGIYDSKSYYYKIGLLSSQTGATPPSTYDAYVVVNLYKNKASSNKFLGVLRRPNGQYGNNYLDMCIVNQIDGSETDGRLLLRAISTTVFGVGTRLALVIN